MVGVVAGSIVLMDGMVVPAVARMGRVLFVYVG